MCTPSRGFQLVAVDENQLLALWWNNIVAQIEAEPALDIEGETDTHGHTLHTGGHPVFIGQPLPRPVIQARVRRQAQRHFRVPLPVGLGAYFRLAPIDHTPDPGYKEIPKLTALARPSPDMPAVAVVHESMRRYPPHLGLRSPERLVLDLDHLSFPDGGQKRRQDKNVHYPFGSWDR